MDTITITKGQWFLLTIGNIQYGGIGTYTR